MGQKNKSKMNQWLIVAVVVLAIAVAGIAFNVTNAPQGIEQQKEIIEATGDAEFCANNPSIDSKVRLKNNLATTSVEYENGTILVKNLDTGSIVEKSITGGGTTDFTTLTDLFECKSTNGYDIYVKADGTINSDGKVTVTADMLKSEPVEITIPITEYSAYKVKCYDNNEKQKIVSGVDGSTDYVTTATSSFNASTSATFATTADQSIDVECTLQPVTANDAKGESLIIAVNTEDESNLPDFDESLTTVWVDNTQLSEASGLSENDLRALNAYENIYTFDGTVGANADGSKSVERKLRVYLQTESGETKTFDPSIKIVATGDYQSIKDDTQILENVGFKDDTSRTELYTAQTITLVVGSAGANS